MAIVLAKVPPPTTQLGNMQRMRDLWTLSLKGDVSIKFFPILLRGLYRRGGEKSVRARGDGEHQRKKAF